MEPRLRFELRTSPIQRARTAAVLSRHWLRSTVSNRVHRVQSAIAHLLLLRNIERAAGLEPTISRIEAWCRFRCDSARVIGSQAWYRTTVSAFRAPRLAFRRLGIILPARGLEPPTKSLKRRRLCRSSSAGMMVRAAGIEPAISRSQSERDTASLRPCSDWSRLRGIEPATTALQERRSTTELNRHGLGDRI